MRKNMFEVFEDHDQLQQAWLMNRPVCPVCRGIIMGNRNICEECEKRKRHEIYCKLLRRQRQHSNGYIGA